MDKYFFDNNNGLWYKLNGDYYLSRLILPPEEERQLGFTDSGICAI